MAEVDSDDEVDFIAMRNRFVLPLFEYLWLIHSIKILIMIWERIRERKANHPFHLPYSHLKGKGITGSKVRAN